jgi:hypothetical protein
MGKMKEANGTERIDKEFNRHEVKACIGILCFVNGCIIHISTLIMWEINDFAII